MEQLKTAVSLTKEQKELAEKKNYSSILKVRMEPKKEMAAQLYQQELKHQKRSRMRSDSRSTLEQLKLLSKKVK